MKKNVAIGIIAGAAGVAVGATAAIMVKNLVDKIKQEIKETTCDYTFTSPNGDNTVTLSYRFSKTAKGLTRIKITAASESKNDSCTLIAISRKVDDLFEGEWTDDEHFKLSIGSGKIKQCCNVNFEGDEIVAIYYNEKNAPKEQVEC